MQIAVTSCKIHAISAVIVIHRNAQEHSLPITAQCSTSARQ